MSKDVNSNDTRDTSALADQRLRELAEAIKPEVRGFTGQWDSFSVVFTVATGLDGLTLQQVDPVFYLESGAFTHGVFSRHVLEKPAVRYIETRTDGRPFQVAVFFFTYIEETKDIETRMFWDQDAVPFLVIPDSWASVAQAANPYREKKA